jgi:hypothetical protein
VRPTSAAKPGPAGTYRDFRGRRWLVSVLRMLHLAGMVGVGAALLAAAPVPGEDAFAMLLVVSGVAMMALDAWSNPLYLRQAAGIAIAFKLGLLLWYLFDAAQRPWLFWLILAVSALAAHAPARLRHRRVLGR